MKVITYQRQTIYYNKKTRKVPEKHLKELHFIVYYILNLSG
jgi:hypothetical protein